MKSIAGLATLPFALAGWVSEHGQLSLGGQYGTQIVDKNGNPVQLRGISTFSPPYYSECIRPDAIAYMKSIGANLVRVAMDADTKYWDAVNWAIDNDMYVLVDYHYIGATPIADDNAKGFFRYAAQQWGNKPNIIYELFNEPADASWSSMKPYMQAMIDVIRPIDSKNLIVAGTPAWSGRTGDVIGDTLNDPLVLYTKHFYASSHYDSDDIGNLLTQIPVFVTEWGVCDYSGSGSIDFGNAQKWQDMMNAGNPAGVWVSWANWGWDDKQETCAYLNPGSCNAGNWGSHTSSGSHVDGYLSAPGPVGPSPSPSPGPSPSPSPTGQCSENPGQNNNGDNLEGSARSASSPSACCDLCSQTSGCVGYTHVTGNNECWLKSRLGSLTSDSHVNSGSVSLPPSPVPSPPTPPAPTPAPSPTPPPSGCPGGSLQACIASCPTDATVFAICTQECSDRCGSSCTGSDDGVDLGSCMKECPTDAASFTNCVQCCASKYPSIIV
jgi:endoglucanase